MQNENKKGINIDIYIEIKLIKKLFQIVSEQHNTNIFLLFHCDHLIDRKIRRLKYKKFAKYVYTNIFRI